MRGEQRYTCASFSMGNRGMGGAQGGEMGGGIVDRKH